MDQKEKLFVVIKHWIEHNETHLVEYKKWSQTAGELGLDLVEINIEEAMGKISQANEHLKKGLETLSP